MANLGAASVPWLLAFSRENPIASTGLLERFGEIRQQEMALRVALQIVIPPKCDDSHLSDPSGQRSYDAKYLSHNEAPLLIRQTRIEVLM